MSRSLLSSTAARRLAQGPSCRLFSTSRASRLSAFSDGELISRRSRPVASSTALLGCFSKSPASRYTRQRFANFSSTSIRPATKVTQNPRTGDDGEPLTIAISPRAIEVSSTFSFALKQPNLRFVFVPLNIPCVVCAGTRSHPARVGSQASGS